MSDKAEIKKIWAHINYCYDKHREMHMNSGCRRESVYHELTTRIAELELLSGKRFDRHLHLEGEVGGLNICTRLSDINHKIKGLENHKRHHNNLADCVSTIEEKIDALIDKLGYEWVGDKETRPRDKLKEKGGE